MLGTYKACPILGSVDHACTEFSIRLHVGASMELRQDTDDVNQAAAPKQGTSSCMNCMGA